MPKSFLNEAATAAIPITTSFQAFLKNSKSGPNNPSLAAPTAVPIICVVGTDDEAMAFSVPVELATIRAEVIQWDTLLELGSHAEARKRGLLRTEGKAYQVQDGDVINVLFNV